MSVEYVSTMSLEYCVSYVPERFRFSSRNADYPCHILTISKLPE